MRFVYPAIFHKTKENTYHGYFPDLEECYGKGETLEDAVDDANAAAVDWITLELEEEGYLPPVTDAEDLVVKEGEVVRNIAVTIRLTDGYDE